MTCLANPGWVRVHGMDTTLTAIPIDITAPQFVGVGDHVCRADAPDRVGTIVRQFGRFYIIRYQGERAKDVRVTAQGLEAAYLWLRA